MTQRWFRWCASAVAATLLAGGGALAGPPVAAIGAGWVDPIAAPTASYAGWWASGCNSSAYISGKVHLGVDIGASVGTPVRSIGPGTVARIWRDGSWGTTNGSDNAGLWVTYTAADGSVFTAVYGHMQPGAGIAAGVAVQAGQPLGTVGVSSYGAPSHLHLGIRPGTSIPSSGWGMSSCPGSANGFVSPRDYLAAHALSGGSQPPLPAPTYPAEVYGPGGPAFSTAGPPQYWRTAAGYGLLGRMLWTNPGGSLESNTATWAPGLGAGRYDVAAFIPRNYANANAHYLVSDANGTVERVVGQAGYSDAWVSLGEFTTGPSGAISVKVTDRGDPYSSSRWIGVDGMRFHYVGAYVPPAPVTYPLSAFNVVAGPERVRVDWIAPRQSDGPLRQVLVEAIKDGTPLGWTTSCDSIVYGTPNQCFLPAGPGGLTLGQTYTVRMKGLTNSGWSDWGPTSAQYLLWSQPGAVSNPVASVVNGHMRLSWAPPLSDGGSPILSYKISRGFPNVEYTVPATARSWTDPEPIKYVGNYTWSYIAISAVNAVTVGGVTQGGSLSTRWYEVSMSIARSKAEVRPGELVTVSGRIMWGPTAATRRSAMLEASAAGGPWREVREVVTDSPDWSVALPVAMSTRYRLRFDGAVVQAFPNHTALTPTMSPVASVVVSPLMTVSATLAKVKGVRVVKVTGKVRPAPGEVVAVQVRRGGTWVTVKRARASSTGGFTARWRPTSSGKYKMRVKVGVAAGHAAGVSRVVAVSFRR
ncbi:MAG: peptidoglycan DD-metalloendopeptidase family protein [Candidatus Nanopelagicales bacterium]